MRVKHYLPPPERCEPLAVMAARLGGTVDTRSAGGTVNYALPLKAAAEVRQFWGRETSAENAPEIVARLPGARVFGAGSVISPDGKSLARDVSLDFGKPFEEHWLLTYGKIEPAQLVGGTAAVVASTLGTGYSHWLLEELPRLLVLKRRDADRVIAHVSHPYGRVALERCGWAGAVLPADRSTHFQCEQLVVPSLLGTVSEPTTRSVKLVAEFGLSISVGGSRFGERIYVTREQARRRKIANESELWAELQAGGFVKVWLEELSWPEQIAAFHDAKVVVAPHGAGLANLVFCQPGTKVVELFNRSYLHGCFWRLAALQGLDYRPLIPATAEPLSQETHYNRLDIHADIQQLRAALR